RVGTHGAGGPTERRIAPGFWLAVRPQTHALDLDERRMLREPERQNLGDALAHPLLLAVERAHVEGPDQQHEWLDARRRGHRQRERDQTPEHQDPERPPRLAGTPHWTSLRSPPRRPRVTTRASAPGPRRRSAMSGISRNATSPTSHGQISTAMRDCRRALRKASRGDSSADPPVSSASSRRSASSTPRSRTSWAYGTTRPASCEPMTRSPRRCDMPTRYTPSCVIGKRPRQRPGPTCSRSITVRSRLGATTPTREPRQCRNTP